MPAAEMVLNTRADRFDRSVQLLEMISQHIRYNYVISIGEKTSLLAQYYKSFRIPRDKVVDMGLTRADAVYNKIMELTDKQSLILAVGNMGAGGLAVANFFRDRGKLREN